MKELQRKEMAEAMRKFLDGGGTIAQVDPEEVNPAKARRALILRRRQPRRVEEIRDKRFVKKPTFR
jgi:hypothetical protein